MKKWKITGQGQVLVIGLLLIVAYKIINNFEHIWRAFLSVLSTMDPFFAGIVIAFFLYRPVKKINRLIRRCKWKVIQRFSMAISTLLVYLVIFMMISLVVKYFVPILYKNIEDFINQVPKYYTVIQDFMRKYGLFQYINIDQFIKNTILPKLNLATLNQYIGVISKIANSFLSAFMSIIFSIYIILEKDNIFGFFKRLFSKENVKGSTVAIMYYSSKMIELFYSYFSGLFTDALIMGAASFLVLAGFGVPYAPLLAVLAAIGNMIPFFGPIVSTVVIALVSALTVGLVRSIWILIAMFVIAQLDANIVQPKILGNSVGVSPLLVLLSVTVFGGLFGAAGMILGVPLIAAGKFVLNDFLDDMKLNGSVTDDKSED
ncbi:MAG: AI-2E family transporter [Ruminococcaceae bacterium]|nr:AI-2E family transporter [Oscillospiraceae bacterium]